MKIKTMNLLGGGLLIAGITSSGGMVWETAQGFAYDSASHMISGDTADTPYSKTPELDTASDSAIDYSLIFTIGAAACFAAGGTMLTAATRRSGSPANTPE